MMILLLLAEGKGKLIDRHTVEVKLSSGGTRRLTAKHILLAQGGRPVRADVPGKVRCCHHAPERLYSIAAVAVSRALCLSE